MLSRTLLLSSVALTALAAPSAHLNARSITIPGALDRGMSLENIRLTNINRDTSDTNFTIIFSDNLSETNNDGAIISEDRYRAICETSLSNFKYNGGNYTVDLPVFGQFRNCAGTRGSAKWEYSFSKDNTGNGFSITARHAVVINNGNNLQRTATFNLPGLSKWTLDNATYPAGNGRAGRSQPDLVLPVNADRDLNVFALTDPGPSNWPGDKYQIGPDATHPPYDRAAEHAEFIKYGLIREGEIIAPP